MNRDKTKVKINNIIRKFKIKMLIKQDNKIEVVNLKKKKKL